MHHNTLISSSLILITPNDGSWRFRTHRIRTHIDSTSDQVLKIYLSLTEQNRQRRETKSHKKCLILFFKSIEGEDELEIESL